MGRGKDSIAVGLRDLVRDVDVLSFIKPVVEVI